MKFFNTIDILCASVTAVNYQNLIKDFTFSIEYKVLL